MSFDPDHERLSTLSPGEEETTGRLYQEIEDQSDDADADPDYQDAPEEGEDEEFFDADGSPGNIQFEVIIDGQDDDEEEEDDDEEDGDEEREEAAQNDAPTRIANGTGLLTRAQLLALLQSRNLGNLLFSLNGDGDEDDDEDDDDVDELNMFFGHRRRRRREPKDPNRFPKVPSDEGTKLMRSGTFGAHDFDMSVQKSIALRMLDRELGFGDKFQRHNNHGLVLQNLHPSTRAEKIIHYDAPIYSGQFSDDGNFFFSVCQDFNVRMYDTSNPYDWKYYKTAHYPWGYWTLTDASLSPDNKWLAYCSLHTMVSIAPTDPQDEGDPYTLNLESEPQDNGGWRGRGFGIFSVRFSGDGREIVAGTNANSLVVYDIEARTVLHHIPGHKNDVNAVCFADKSSPHILYSGSDDTMVKVWDRRSMADGREAGAFVGHTEGITYIDSKGDGRYILSNGKDQNMKLWDLRMVMSSDRFRGPGGHHRSYRSGFDYRGDRYDDEDWEAHPDDNSVVTFRGHKVLRTLIRCHFSPPNSTNSRYVYSGSADGKVYVYNMDGTVANIIDVKDATQGTGTSDRRSRMYFRDVGGWGTCVRDASWHPNAPFIVASAWNGPNMDRGTCSVHSFNQGKGDEGPDALGRSVNEMLKTNPKLVDRAETDD